MVELSIALLRPAVLLLAAVIVWVLVVLRKGGRLPLFVLRVLVVLRKGEAGLKQLKRAGERTRFSRLSAVLVNVWCLMCEILGASV